MDLFALKLSAESGFVVQLLSRVWLFAIPWTAAHQASLSFTISWSLLKLMSTESVMPSNQSQDSEEEIDSRSVLKGQSVSHYSP